ncbi:hypothetical protein AGLY_010269 [Aphis glycines]|uniref:Uncharacterized protein n=1 Tax=Aphis glycines TaxID=307491 RepID=A0A6G0TGT9_APHGL|nr:hypothetical protein AGLY_010269 [Aphis glycines]
MQIFLHTNEVDDHLMFKLAHTFFIFNLSNQSTSFFTISFSKFCILIMPLTFLRPVKVLKLANSVRSPVRRLAKLTFFFDGLMYTPSTNSSFTFAKLIDFFEAIKNIFRIFLKKIVLCLKILNIYINALITLILINRLKYFNNIILLLYIFMTINININYYLKIVCVFFIYLNVFDTELLEQPVLITRNFLESSSCKLASYNVIPQNMHQLKTVRRSNKLMLNENRTAEYAFIDVAAAAVCLYSVTRCQRQLYFNKINNILFIVFSKHSLNVHFDVIFCFNHFTIVELGFVYYQLITTWYLNNRKFVILKLCY